MSEMQTWSTDSLTANDRFTSWAEKMRATHLAWDLSSPIKQDYAARIRFRGTRRVQVADVRCAEFAGRRDGPSEGEGVVGIQLQLSGRMMCSYRDQQFTIEPGDLFVWDDDLQGMFQTDGSHRQISLLVPEALIPQSVSSRLGSSRPISAKPGRGALSIAAGQMRSLANEMELLNDDAVNRTVNGLIDLLDVSLAPAMGTTQSQRSSLLAAVQQYILERLDDRQMSVPSIAAANAVSVRTLQLVFAEAGTSVARWVREQRLERCRRELEGASESTTVTDIAFRWGFNDASHFSRVFKREFGVSPATVRGGGSRRTSND
ncbi:helix-turn-helix domain-containing protein [Brevibacterium sp. BDJS002]|uniref:helix-turn-helix domain-containing protein n=1 Tax=Brevibacterium sp. BDJS002 TaxID=3020906 RepID=UPI0023076D26|nr:helix-turn-helix domain-containing protein [Brevibacterium sp. BDJS002]WCE41132.1 helix-turn-helix domain-containing protein [Brevibacterium sp. BDJS002]